MNTKVIFVDIDNTICVSSSMDYKKAVPLHNRIAKINQLYEEGNTIVYWTARGTQTGIDWHNVTKTQLQEWGVGYNELLFGKPSYDLFIDDKNIDSDTFFKDIKETV